MVCDWEVSFTIDTCSAWQEIMQRRTLFAVGGESYKTISCAVLSTLTVFQISSHGTKGTQVKKVPPRWLKQLTNFTSLISV
jgi:hypothetical protein